MRKVTLQNALRLALGIFLFLLPWQTMWITREPMLNGAKWEFGTLGLYATELLLWVVIVAFMVWFLKERYKIQDTRYKFRFSKDRIFLLAVLSFISYLLLSIIWSADKELALQQSVHVIEAFLLFTVLFVGPLSFASSARWFIGGAMVQSILGIWQFATQSTLASKLLGLAYHPVALGGTSVVEGIATGRWLRTYGAFPHPNVFGGYLVVALILLLLLYNKTELKNKLSLISHHVSLIFILTGLFFTFSRSAWIAAVIVTLLHCYIVIRRKLFISYHISLITSGIIVVSVLSLIFFPFIKTRFSNESAYEVRSTSERISGYSEAWQLFKQHPWQGVGAGNYTVALQMLNSNQPGYVYQPVHNVGVLTIVELGIVGTVLVIIVILSFIMYHLSSIPRPHLYYWLLVTSYLPLLFFDHYLLSLYIGLMLSAVLWGGGTRFVHELSTE